MQPPIQPRQRTQYKKPRKINGVSVTLTALFGGFLFYAFHTWPVFMLRVRAKGEMEELLPRLWRVNLMDRSPANRDIPAIRKELTTALRKVGVKDPKLEIVIERNQKIVAFEARFAAPVTYPIIDKTIVYELAPRAQTDAARVDW
jgi:hypothetical protein